MLKAGHPKLPMRNRAATIAFYVDQLQFRVEGDYGSYIIVRRDQVELHFFESKNLDPNENDGQVYIRTDAIDQLYQEWLDRQVPIHPNGHLEDKLWGQREFALLDPDHNLLTFGQPIP
ncbi:MAG: VOC family protein [Saprospiraceae bacterium]